MEGKFNSYLLTERQFLMGLSGRMGMQIGIKRCIYFVCKLKCDKSSSLGGSVEVSSLNANKGLSKSAEIHFVQLHEENEESVRYQCHCRWDLFFVYGQANHIFRVVPVISSSTLT